MAGREEYDLVSLGDNEYEICRGEESFGALNCSADVAAWLDTQLNAPIRRARAAGIIGGSSRSKKKALASRANGQKNISGLYFDPKTGVQ